MSRFALASFLVVVSAALSGCGSTAPGVAASTPETGVEPPFSLRDPREGLSSGALGARQSRLLDLGMAALRAHDLKTAERKFRAGAAASPAAPPFALGVVYVALVSERWSDAEDELRRLLAEAPDYAPALEAEGDLDAYRGNKREAFVAYQAALKSLPGDARLTARVALVRGELVEETSDEAWKLLEAGDFDAARRAGLALLELDAGSPSGYQVLSSAAEEGGNLEDSWTWAEKAHGVDPTDDDWTETTAEIAMKTGRFAEATALYDDLSVREPAYREHAERARFEFQVRNLPEPAQKAARSPRLTRAQFASLAWYLVPEFRDGTVPGPPEVAVDVVDRLDRTQIIRAIGLGFLAVSRDTHRLDPEQTLSRKDFTALLRKVARLTARSRTLPPCLASDALPSSSLEECGILSETSSRGIGGRSAMRAIERAARAGREGAVR
ncbi:MAG TPA: hypothetical protein VGR00_01660 [Thermoanaerobaculia bacterium]|nr:hypothetical protein [Thermoanaerobaculia bacterium]